jgi:hypothetical protein
MSLMDKQKAEIIKKVFLVDGHFDSANEDVREYFQKQLNLSTKYKKIKIFGTNRDGITVLEALKDKVREDRRNLAEDKKVAKTWFNRYMSFKAIMNYSDEKDRRKFNSLKYFHKDSVFGVQMRKSQLKQDEVLLNKFSEYLTLTQF